MSLNEKRVVMSGLGVISPLGNSCEEFWKNLCMGADGVSGLTKLNPQDFQNDRVAEVHDFEQSPYAKDPRWVLHSQTLKYLLAASDQALNDAHALDLPKQDMALILGSTLLCQDIADNIVDHPDFVHMQPMSTEHRLEFEHIQPENLLAELSAHFALEGPQMIFPAACAAGNYALGAAQSLIRSGACSWALVGAADPLTRSCYGMFDRMHASSPDVVKPFDQNRKGMVVGEGAGVLVLESLEHAQKRSAPIYAELLSYGLSCDAYHPTAPHPQGQGAIQAMKQALDYAHLKPEDIDYVSAHGTGTKANDASEANALAAVFESHLKTLPVSSIKSMLGHCMGAASSLEAIACALALKGQKIPPTIHTETLDPNFPIAFDWICNQAQSKPLDYVMSNAFAFGGNVSSVILGRLEL